MDETFGRETFTVTKSDIEQLRPILSRYRKVVRFSTAPDTWNKQWTHGQPFAYQKHRLTDRELAGALLLKWWIAARAPSSGRTDVIRFDIDCDGPSEVGSRDSRYWWVRSVMGADRVPLVYQTPSGFGLRVCYRIPSISLSRLVTGQREGIVADVLRGAGLPVGRGQIEIFPQQGQCDRLPLGRNMPIFDAATLEPFADSNIGSVFCLSALEAGLRRMEMWHDTVLHDLVDYLEGLPRVGLKAPSSPSTVTLTPHESGQLLPPTAPDVIERGLTAYGTRRRAEWSVGRAFITSPNRYPQFGLSDVPSDQQVASAIARWLSIRHNGFSNDWRAVLASMNNDEKRAVEHFASLYLERDASGRHFIDRLVSATVTDDPSMEFTPELSGAEWARVLETASRNFPAGAARYRFEVWYVEFIRRMKLVILHGRRAGTTQLRRVPELDFPDEDYAVVQVQAKWMERWPFGAGISGGKTSYLRYLDILRSEKVLRLHTPHRAPKTASAKGTAKKFYVRLPDLSVRRRDTAVDREMLAEAILDLRGFGAGQLSQSEAFHALHVTSLRQNLAERYGRKTADRVKRIADDVVSRIDGLMALSA